MTMKKIGKVFGVALLILSFFTVASWAQEESVGSAAAFEQDTFTLEQMLTYALEDEVMAEAEYAEIIKEFGVGTPFTNIIKAEMTHQEAVLGLFEARDIEIPEFEEEDYIVLPDTLAEIYTVGIQAEINNIAMYDMFLEQDLDMDVRQVFEALRNASLNHQAAFERASQRSAGIGYGNRNRKFR